MDCGVQGNTQLHNKRGRKGCQHGSKDIATFKGCSCSQKTCSGITAVPWVQANSRAPARDRLLLGHPLLQGKGFHGAGSRALQSQGRSLCSAEQQPAGCRSGANTPLTTANCLQRTLQAQPPPQQLPRVPKQMLLDPQAAQGAVPGTCTSLLLFSSFSRQGLRSGCFPRERFLSPNSQECQFTLMSDELRLASLLSGSFALRLV